MAGSGMWCRSKNRYRNWKEVETDDHLEEGRDQLLKDRSFKESSNDRKKITDELRQHILPDCVTTIDWYLSGCYPLPEVPDLCENIFELAPNINCDTMERVPNCHSTWDRYRGIVIDEKECFVDNRARSDDWWLCDERGQNKIVADILMSACFHRRAALLNQR